MDLIFEVMLYEQVLRKEIFSCLGKLDYLIIIIINMVYNQTMSSIISIKWYQINDYKTMMTRITVWSPQKTKHFRNIMLIGTYIVHISI